MKSPKRPGTDALLDPHFGDELEEDVLLDEDDLLDDDADLDPLGAEAIPGAPCCAWPPCALKSPIWQSATASTAG